MVKFTGGCLCGDVRYEIGADPVFAGFCHCRDCQRAGGGGHSVIGAFPAAAVKVVKGATTDFSSAGGSGGTVTRRFCGRCGSRLFSSSQTAGPLLMVAVGSLDDPNLLSPALHIYGRDRSAWDHVHAEHMVFETTPPGPPPSS